MVYLFTHSCNSTLRDYCSYNEFILNSQINIILYSIFFHITNMFAALIVERNVDRNVTWFEYK